MEQRRDGMVDVDLVEDGPAPRTGREKPRVEGPGQRAEPAVPWRPRAIAAAVAVLVVVAATWGSGHLSAAADRRDAARVAAYADVEGIAPSLRRPLEARWRTSSFLGAASDVVLTGEGADGASRIVAREPGTGEPRWTAPDLRPVGAAPRCTGTPAEGPLVVCEVPGLDGHPASNTDLQLGGTPDRLVVLHADDGRVVAERPLAAGTYGWVPVGEDVVVAQREGSSVRIERSALVGERTLWSAAVPLTAEVRPGLWVHVRVRDGSVSLSGLATAVLDAADGAVLATWVSPGPGRGPVRVVLSSAGFGGWPSPGDGTWYDRAGRPGARLVGDAVVPAIDDGSWPGILLVQDAGRLRAVDVHRGVLWERPPVLAASLRVAGVVVLQDAAGLTAVDVVTGRQLWSVGWRAGDDRLPPEVTDGARFLVLGREPGLGRIVSAHDLRDGSRSWSAQVPEDVTRVSVVGGHVIGWGDEVTVLAGP